MRKIAALFAVSLLVVNCEKSSPALEWFPQMQDSPARETMENDHFFQDGMAMRQAPEGTIARGQYIYPYDGSPDDLRGGLTNPLKATSENIIKGEAKFQTFCSPCHGVRGEGNGRVVGGYPRFTVPMFNFSLLSPKIQGWSDGQIFHMITMGRGQMASYAAQVSPDDRWRIVMYLRKLQQYNNKVAKK